jgi:hypothetical protein
MNPLRLLLALLLVLNCARHGKPLEQWQQIPTVALVEIISSHIVSVEPQSDGSTITRFNSTEQEKWVYFSFSQNKEIFDNVGWDLGIQRFKFSTNSGITNSSGLGGGCKTNSKDWTLALNSSRGSLGCSDSSIVIDSNVTETSVGGVATNFNGNKALTDWYNYSIGNLEPNGNIYIVRNFSGSRYFLMKVVGYYSVAGTSGYPSIQWKELK